MFLKKTFLDIRYKLKKKKQLKSKMKFEIS